jgi:hypothetical protein
MNIRQIVTGVVVFSLVASTLPAMAATPAGSTPDAVAPETVNTFRASLDRAVASVVEPATAETSTTSAPGSKRGSLQAPLLAKQFGNEGTTMANEEQVGVAGGGGGSHLGLIIGLVTTAASLAATYIVIKQMKKATSSIPNVPQVP